MLRRENTAKKRQSIFIAEYVFNKHFHIYQEAAEEFNRINKLHPKKPDLRKSIEFKNWKRQLKGLPEIRPCKKRDPATHVIYPSITVDQQLKPQGQKVMQLVIPLLDLEPDREEESINQVHDEVLDEGDTECLTAEKETTVNNNQVLEESDEVSGIQPSLFADISSESFEQILEELRSDPNLASIMNDFETFNNEQFETTIDEQFDIGMNVQISESLEQEIDDRLEKELQDMDIYL